MHNELVYNVYITHKISVSVTILAFGLILFRLYYIIVRMYIIIVIIVKFLTKRAVRERRRFERKYQIYSNTNRNTEYYDGCT